MPVQIPHTGTEYTANALTISRGTPADILSVGVYHNTNPNTVPAAADFTAATLVLPGDPLADGSNVDVLCRIGSYNGGTLTLTAGDWQRWVLVTTAYEQIIRKVDLITII